MKGIKGTNALQPAWSPPSGARLSFSDKLRKRHPSGCRAVAFRAKRGKKEGLLTADCTDLRRFFIEHSALSLRSTDSTDYSEKLCGSARGFYRTEIIRNYPEILSEILFPLRMIRTKSELGGDGVSHHRSTSDGGRHDKRVYQCWPLSNVGFRVRNRPPRSYFIRLIRVRSVWLQSFSNNYF